MPLTEPEIAYVAGTLDAMARIKTVVANGTTLPLVAVSCPNMALLEHLSTVSGLKAFETHREYDRHRCGEHCVEAHDHIVSRSGRWSANGARATIMLAAVQPHIRVQTDEVAEVLAVGMETPAKAHVVQSMAALGWPIPEQWTLHHTGRGLVVLRG
jgi:hypothetical protein